MPRRRRLGSRRPIRRPHPQTSSRSPPPRPPGGRSASRSSSRSARASWKARPALPSPARRSRCERRAQGRLPRRFVAPGDRRAARRRGGRPPRCGPSRGRTATSSSWAPTGPSARRSSPRPCSTGEAPRRRAGRRPALANPDATCARRARRIRLLHAGRSRWPSPLSRPPPAAPTSTSRPDRSGRRSSRSAGFTLPNRAHPRQRADRHPRRDQRPRLPPGTPSRRRRTPGAR